MKSQSNTKSRQIDIKSVRIKRSLKFVLVVLLGFGSILLSNYRGGFVSNKPVPSENQGFTNLENLKKAFENQQSNFQVKQSGRIIKILPDDRHSPRHQRFIVQLDSGQKLLLAHNIELASRVEGLKEGASILFCGEYEWNNKGGVIHWTHHDPKGIHPPGWLFYDNRRYD